ncbi:hypothetical protein NMG60_11037375 [Bertholletia excelsa]
MDGNAAKQPFLSQLVNPTPPADKKGFRKRRRFRHSRSAPSGDFAPAEVNDNGSLPHSQSIFNQLHPTFKKVAIVLALYVGIGTICFYFVGNQFVGTKTDGLVDAVYFCMVTMMTVGYGDLVPSTVPTKLLACAFVFSGMAIVGLVLSKIADYLVEKQEVLLVKALYMYQEVDETEILKKIETNRARYKFFVACLLLVVLIIVGTIFLVTVEELDLVDAFYCVCSTITTLGYGDKSFSTKAGRIFAVFWILMSTICLAQFFLYIAELSTENKQRELVKWVLTRKVTNADLEAADIDDDGDVGAAEFILYKLKEMGKISQEDILLVMEQFEDLDVDQSGTLSGSDITLAQSCQTGK